MILDNSMAQPDVSQSLYHDQDAHSWLKPKINIRVFINAQVDDNFMIEYTSPIRLKKIYQLK